MHNNRSNHRNHCMDVRRWQAVLCLLVAVLLGASCSQDDHAGIALPDGEYEVRLLVNAESVAADTRAEGDVSVIRELRVYVFNAEGERVGHYYNGNLSAAGTAYYVPLRLSEGGDLDFYVVANENGAGISLSETTTKRELDDMSFQTESINQSNGDLLRGQTSEEITAADVQGGATKIITCELSRPFSLLDVRFAKVSEMLDVVVTGIELYDYTTGGTLFENTSYTPVYATGSLRLLDAEQEVTQVVAADERITGDYGEPFATQVVAPNPAGTGEWVSDNTEWETAPGEEKKPRLEIAYRIGETSKSAIVYLPPMMTNHRYGVNCLITADGLTLNLNVLPWEKEESEIVWSDTPDPEIVITKSTMTENGETFFPIRYTVTNNPEDTNDFYFNFKLTSPQGMRWVASIDNGQDFFFCDPNSSSPSITDNYVPGGYADAAGERVVIRLKAFGPYNENAPQQVRLAIRYQAADGTWNRLMINKDADDNPLTSSDEDVILIKQIPN